MEESWRREEIWRRRVGEEMRRRIGGEYDGGWGGRGAWTKRGGGGRYISSLILPPPGQIHAFFLTKTVLVIDMLAFFNHFP